MSACPACGQPFRSDDIVTSRLGQILHSRCIERWQRDDTDDATAKFSD